MRTNILYRILSWGIALTLFTACERRPLEDGCTNSALIPVNIDWSRSGIVDTPQASSENVHRVSVRLFPKNGAAAFDRYLELDVNKGSIEVPVGSYSVVVMNESVYDPYWSDAIYFTDMDSYSDFAANVIDDDPSTFVFYTPEADEQFAVEPLSLASWSLDNFEVTPQMVIATRKGYDPASLPQPTRDMIEALTHVVMRRLTYNVHVVAQTTNLISSQTIQGVTQGFANKVYMAAATTTQTPRSHIFPLNIRTWSDDSHTHGTAEKSFLSFGRLPSPSTYKLHLDVLFFTGELYKPTPPMLYDVTDQVNNTISPDIEIKVNLELPYVKGGIDVGGWTDEDHVLN